jgi:hypothetical protein
MNRVPVQRSKLYFLLAWFHAIIQERVQCVPYGFTKFYEFTDTHKMIALDAIDYWVDNVPKVCCSLPFLFWFFFLSILFIYSFLLSLFYSDICFIYLLI